MKFEYDGKYYLVFKDGIRIEVDRDLWQRLMSLKEAAAL